MIIIISMLNQNKINQNSLIFKKNSDGENDKIQSVQPPVEPKPVPTNHVVVNNIEYHNKISNDSDNFLVKFDNSTNTFSFITNDKQNTFIGSFSIKQLIKYVVDVDNVNFLSSTSFDTSISIINRFICVKNDDGILIHDYMKSPFMGNLDMLIKLNNLLHSAETSEIFDVLPIDDKNNAVTSLKIFNFGLLNHTLKVITSASKNSGIDENTKKKLLQYTVGIVYRMTFYVKSQVEKNMRHVNLTISNIKKIKSIRENIDIKLDQLNETISNQNNVIGLLITKINSLQMKGGNINEPTSEQSESVELSDDHSLPSSKSSDMQDIQNASEFDLSENQNDEDDDSSSTNSGDDSNSSDDSTSTDISSNKKKSTQDNTDDDVKNDEQIGGTTTDDKSKKSTDNKSNVTLSDIIANFENSENAFDESSVNA